MINAWVYLVVGVLGIIITVTLIGCLLTIVAIWTRPVLRKLVNVPLASLSCADILFTIFGPALWIPVFLHPGWEPPGALCWFQGYLNPIPFRGYVPRAAVIVTDGRTQLDVEGQQVHDNFAESARAARDCGMELYSIAAGRDRAVDRSELDTITDNPARVVQLGQDSPCAIASMLVKDLCDVNQLCRSIGRVCTSDADFCAGPFVPGLCRGNLTCCAPQDEPCRAMGGVCQFDDLPCPGRHLNGLCGGPVNRKCCIDCCQQPTGADVTYRSLGCWTDSNIHAIPPLEGLDHRLQDPYRLRENAIDKCYQAARDRGYDVFALQDGGWCASSSAARQAYRQYGPSRRCGPAGKGGVWANHVYEII
ncbi:Hypp7279 [Branchiostoma lanceolatum]|uniref:Hypp7279 protein n=1 Tax=Branchiostoma lanceolatum TaxID=7740 RepID=A0A8J9YZ86_BRALA|nr:Hypp7279 [Branchiostoma lanceolatum]